MADRFSPASLERPIVQAPMAGGPSTPALAAAVSNAGGLGFLAAGYKSAAAVAQDIARTRALTDRPFGVNVFCPPGPPGDRAEVERYAAAIGADPAGARHDDDGWAEKLELLEAERVAVVSFTFGCPPAGVVGRLRAAGAATWVTITTPLEAREAAAAGADGLVAQGVEAGGHRGSFDPSAPGDVGLLALLVLTRAAVELPVVATGGIADGRGVAAVLAAGAAAAQAGTAFLDAQEAATAPAHRAALRSEQPTAITRVFTGRPGRGILNRFMLEHDHEAPLAYPEIHHLTARMRAAARQAGDAGGFNLWAGQAYALTQARPAAETARALADGASARR